MNAEKTTKAANELFEQAMKSYEQALKTGLKLQEESAKYWKNLASHGLSSEEWQTKMATVAKQLIPETQKGLENSLKLIEENNRAGLELMKKAATVTQSTSVEEAQNKMIGFWEASLQALRNSAEAATEANNKAIHSWVEFLTSTPAARTARKA